MFSYYDSQNKQIGTRKLGKIHVLIRNTDPEKFMKTAVEKQYFDYLHAKLRRKESSKKKSVFPKCF